MCTLSRDYLYVIGEHAKQRFVKNETSPRNLQLYSYLQNKYFMK